MRLGIDFDNTIIAYDAVFQAVVAEKSWLNPVPADKTAIRDALRQMPQGESMWQQLQALVYGRQILRATGWPGVADALQSLKTAGHQLFLVSHKTVFAAADTACNLHDAALAWLGHNGFFGTSDAPFERQNMFFEPTRAKKLERIDALNCHVFVDDLVEVLTDRQFPKACRAVLFSPNESDITVPGVSLLRRWQDVGVLLHGR